MDNYDDLIQKLFLQLRRAYYTSPEINYSTFLQGEMKILNYLYSINKPVLPGELCRVLYMTSARMSAALKSLSKKGYIERGVSENDKRTIPVMLTKKGCEYFSGKKSQMMESYKKMFMKLGKEDLTEFIRIMEKLNDIASFEESERL
jgi:DNA-binding MarR family transcriptional regulator